MSYRKILITGGLGFQGFSLAKFWSGRGDHVVVLNTPSERALAMSEMLRDNCQIVWGSVTDPEVMNKIVVGCTHLVHLAAWTSVDQSFTQPRAVYRVNSEAMYVVLEAVRQNNPEVRFLAASSCEVYGNTGTVPATEDHPLRPHSPYAAAKAAGDRLAYSYAVTYGLNLTILRPCNIFGPWQKSGAAGAVIPTFLEAARRGGPLRVTGDGSQRREFLYIEDLVRAYDVLLDAKVADITYNVGSGQIRSIFEIASLISRRYGVKVEFDQSAARPGEVSNFHLDSSLFMRTTGWTPQVLPFEEGLRRTMEWADARGPTS